MYCMYLLVYFQEFKQFTSDKAVLFCLGIILIITGNEFLSRRDPTEKANPNLPVIFDCNPGQCCCVMRRQTIQELKEEKEFFMTWGVGIAFVVIGGILDIVALNYAAQSLLAPISSITLLVNALLTHYVLGEDLQTQDLVGLSFLCVGAVIAIIFAPHITQNLPLEELKSAFIEPMFLTYLVFILLVVVVSVIVLYMYSKEAASVQEVEEKQNTCQKLL